jgi:AraC-like DNA-binding protein
MAGWAEKLLDSATPAAWDAPRSSASAALLVQVAAERGVPAQRCLRATGITRDVLDDPAGEIRARQELALAGNIVRALGDPPGLGLDAGSRYHLTTYGIWGFALISSSTLREAISVGLRFLDLTYTFVDVSTQERAGELLLVLDDEAVPPEVRRFMVERDAAAIMLIQRELFGRSIALRRVAFRYPPPPDARPYEEIFGTRPQFAARQNIAAVDAAVLDRPLPQASPYAAQLSQRQCRELLDRRRVRLGVAGRVRHELLKDPRRMPSQDQVAATLHMSVRTLRRQLAYEGTTFRALVEETRQLLAEELLATGHLTIEEIADRVGYAEASSFVHAFKRWKGTPPRRYARAASATDA